MGVAPQTVLTTGPTIAYKGGPGPASQEDLANAVRALVLWTQQNAGAVVHGPTTARPIAFQLQHLVGAGIGYMFYDTTLSLPVWWDGVNWRNAAGVIS